MLATRAATIADAALISAHRHAMFASMRGFDELALEQMRRASQPWLTRVIGEGKYLGWVTSDVDLPVASAGLLILDWPPHPFDPTGETRGYLLMSSWNRTTAAAGWLAHS